MPEKLVPVLSANLDGVWAKWNRAIEQLNVLDKEVLTFSQKSDAYKMRSEIGPNNGEHVFRIYPAWQPGVPLRWGAIIGEIVHDFRSALDQLVWQLVILNGGEPDTGHSFPFRRKEPREGFAVATRYRRRDSRKRIRHGPLFGVSDEAVAIIERYQPYQGGNRVSLTRLHCFWNVDKHRHLIPTRLKAETPSIKLSNAILRDRSEGFDGEAYAVRVVIAGDGSGRDSHVDVEPQTPFDIAFSTGPPVIAELRAVGKILIKMLQLIAELFPGESGLVVLPT